MAENKKSFGTVDVQRRPYAAFALFNPLIAQGLDVVDYTLAKCLASIDSGICGALYLELAVPFAQAIQELSEDGPMLEDADVLSHSGITRDAHNIFTQIRPTFRSDRFKNVVSLSGPIENLFYGMVKHHLVRDLSLEQQKLLLEQELQQGLVEYGDSLLNLDTPLLEMVVARAVAWRNREEPKRSLVRSLERQAPNSGPEKARYFEQNAGLDFGGYDWNAYQCGRPAGISTGSHCVNVLIHKDLLVDKLEKELSKRKTK